MDRINKLRERLKLPRTSFAEIVRDGCTLHDELDMLDRKVGIITRHGKRHVYGIGGNDPLVQEYVGARLARLERHLGAITPPFFWLGANAAAA